MNTQHIAHLLDGVVRRRGDKVALRTVGERSNRTFNWTQVGELASACAKALLKEGLEVQGKVAIFARNMPEWSITDYAILKCRGVVVPIHPTNTIDQTRYVVEHSGARILFVGEQKQYDIAVELLNAGVLDKVVMLCLDIDWVAQKGITSFHEFCDQGTEVEAAIMQERMEQAEMSDLVTLIYTSGTTGNPKGVMLDHDNFATCFEVNLDRVPLTPEDVSFCFLPLSHVFERAWTLYLMTRGAENVYLKESIEIMDHIADVKPTVMCAVPRLYEKVFSAVQQKLETASSSKRKLFAWALERGKERFHCQKANEKMGTVDSFKYAIADKLVLSKLRAVFGGNVRYLPCSGASLSDEVASFFYHIGIRVVYGYGMTETTATVSCYDNYNFEIGEVGTPMPTMQIKIGENDEILLKAGTIMRGYYNDEKATAEALDQDGWLHTGDAGRVANGKLYYTERIKELMKTSNGKYVAPQWVEGIISQDPYVEQIAVIADSRNFVSALIVPSFEALEEYAKKLGISYSHPKELLDNQSIKEFLNERIEAIQGKLAQFEKVKRFRLLPEAFSMEEGELTPSLKLRRKVIERKYRQLIESMYK